MGRLLGGSGRRKTTTIVWYVITVVAAMTSRRLIKIKCGCFVALALRSLEASIVSNKFSVRTTL